MSRSRTRSTIALCFLLVATVACAQQQPPAQTSPPSQPAQESPEPRERPVLRQRTAADDAAQPATHISTFRPITPLLRMQRLKSPDAYSPSIEDTCVVIQDDLYRIERRTQRADEPKAKLVVYEDKLPAESTEQLRQLLAKDDVRALKSDDLLGGGESMFIQDPAPESMILSIGRDGEPTQTVTVHRKPTYEANKKALKPVLEWVKQLEKRKVEPQKDPKSNHCIFGLTTP